MQMRAAFFASTFLLCYGCGNDSSESRVDEGGTGGLASTDSGRGGMRALGGSTANAESGTSGSGGSTPLSRTQGGSSVGGVSNQGLGGNTSSVAVGGSAVAGSNSSTAGGCPVWPRSKLLPTIGPQFYGPDPGPCSRTATATNGVITATAYGYVDQAINAVSDGGTVRKYTRTDGIVTGYTSTSTADSSSGVVAWDANSVTITASTGSVLKIMLGLDGYPLESWIATAASIPLIRNAQYEYSNCRLARRAQFKADGTEDSLNSSEYDYDAAGHIASEHDGWGTVLEYNYGCW